MWGTPTRRRLSDGERVESKVLTARERAVLGWMQANRVGEQDTSWYTDQIGTSARLLARLSRLGYVVRDDPDANRYTRSGSGAISWRLSLSGRNVDVGDP